MTHMDHTDTRGAIERWYHVALRTEPQGVDEDYQVATIEQARAIADDWCERGSGYWAVIQEVSDDRA